MLRLAVLPRLSRLLLAPGRYLSVTSTEAAVAASPQEAFGDAAAIAAELNGEPDAAALEHGVVGVTKARRARRRASPVSAAVAGSQPQQSRATAIWTAYSRFDELDLRDVEEVAEPKGKSSSKKAIKKTAKTAGVPDAATTPDPSKVPPA